MRMVRIQSGRPARADSRYRSSCRPSPHFFQRLFAQVRRLGASSLGLDSDRYFVDGSSDDRRVASEQVVDLRARWLATSVNFCARGQDPVPKSSVSIRLRGAAAGLELADAPHDSTWGASPSAACQERRSTTGLEAIHGRADGREPKPALVASVITHRPRLNSRKKVADFVRAFGPTGSGDVLRAFFVGDDCSYLQGAIVARSTAEILALCARDLLHMASVAGAAGVILARGVAASTTSISEAERTNANQLKQVAEELGIYLLDYVIVRESSERGLFAIHRADRDVCND